MEESKIDLNSLAPSNYLSIATNARKFRQSATKILLEKRKLPENGWTDEQIEEFVRYLSSLDSNNFSCNLGLGEREGRVICDLVSRRHYSFSHGIGRSGDLLEPQPKAVGSTILSNLVNFLLLDLIRTLGIHNTKFCFLVPMATGMTLNLCFVTLKKIHPNRKFILWSRIDQKSCFKSITISGIIPIIIDTIETENSLSTDINKFESKIKELGSDQILCIYSTTSCFAPRNCDDIITLAEIAKIHNIPHVVNNAYGLQSTYHCHQIEQAHQKGKLDIFVQSTDKNLLVPVGGAIVAGFDEVLIKEIAKTYAGRASSSQCLDTLMTLLSLGKNGFLKIIKDRKFCFQYLQEKLQKFSIEKNETLYCLKRNPISMALTLNTLKNDKNISEIGSMLFTRGVSGVRVISHYDEKTLEGNYFKCWGSHHSNSVENYMTVAASLGITIEEIDIFIQKLTDCWKKFASKYNKSP